MRGSELLAEWLSDAWRIGRVLAAPTLLFGAIIALSTLGYIHLGWAPFNALYMVVITVFSVGYGEIEPVDSFAERAWTMLVIIGGWGGVLVTLGRLTQFIAEGELMRATSSVRKLRAVEHLRDHVIICGYGRMGQTLARELARAGTSFVIVDSSDERVAQIASDGFLALRGNATEEEVLRQAGIGHARVLATVLPQDAFNVYITLTARELSPSVRIIARGEQPSTEKKLHQAGADEVILPSTIGALRIAHSINEPAIMRLLHEGAAEVDWHALGLEVDELALHNHAHLVGKSVGEIHRMAAGAIMVLGVRRGASVLRDGVEELVLCEGDALIALARTSELPAALSRDVDRTELL